VLSFRREDRDRVARGEITVSFRLWKTPKVKVGKLYPTGFGTIQVDDVQVIPAALVTRKDVRPSGCPSIAAIWELAGDHTNTEVRPDTLLHRVQFRFLGDVPPDSARAPVEDLRQLAARLEKMDRLASRGPWTQDVLRLIHAAPHVPARVLAADLGWETLDFKAHVRRLKALGLTISHEIGYELSDVGRRYLATTGTSSRPLPAAAARRSPRTPRRSR
jgi:hypothetical protein